MSAVSQASVGNLLQCKEVFVQKPLPIGSLLPDFPHHTRYTKEIKEKTRVLNQCALGTCHMHSWLSQLESLYMARTGKELQLSTHYLTYRLWKKRIHQALQEPVSGEFKGISLANYTRASLNDIKEFGLIPDKAWTFERDFIRADKAKVMTDVFNNIVDNMRLYKIGNPPEHLQQKMLQEAYDQVDQVFESLLGKIPETFDYNSQKINPQKFAKENFYETGYAVTTLELGSKSMNVYYQQMDTMADTPHEYGLEVIRQLIDANQSIYMAYDHQAQYVDKETGVMSVEGFYYPFFAKPLPREARREMVQKKLRSENLDFKHAVQIVGYDLDPQTGKILKLKIKNSWGSITGDDGYFHMYVDYFNRFAYELTFFSTSLVPL